MIAWVADMIVWFSAGLVCAAILQNMRVEVMLTRFLDYLPVLICIAGHAWGRFSRNRQLKREEAIRMLEELS